MEEPDVRSHEVKLMSLAEKLALMGSHFLTLPQIARLFCAPDARVRVEAGGPTACIIVEKAGGPQ